MIGIDDFAKVELRVAEIVACEPVKRAKKLLKLTLNDGQGQRVVASGIAKYYTPDQLVGRHVVLVANLKPAVLCGVESCGMILAADCAGGDVKVIFVDEIPAGEQNPMNGLIFDSHAHYDDKAFDSDRGELLAALPQNGVGGVVNCGASLESSRTAVALAEAYPYVYAAVGVHPEEVKGAPEDYLEQLKNLASQPKVAAIGEIGLDYYWKENAPPEIQKKFFESQLLLAKELSLPVIIHDREAHGDTMALLQKYKPQGVLHCFSGSVETARQAVKLGLYLGFGGSVTFKNTRHPVEAAGYPPGPASAGNRRSLHGAGALPGTTERLLLICYVAEKIAQIRGITAEQVLNAAFENTRRPFSVFALRRYTGVLPRFRFDRPPALLQGTAPAVLELRNKALLVPRRSPALLRSRQALCGPAKEPFALFCSFLLFAPCFFPFDSKCLLLF